ncbi:hypothetical protein QA601_18785 [Chitinispirillales bacterium ANBcel5]|uniref:hypothetical protein n=1 Tax=Cellulosispirillum alkaliphilum TaxID=3039283 RepID=UPI002A58BD7A|nr:hypothetical protein [Chitinispirillales bacterium ANBcel5]
MKVLLLIIILITQCKSIAENQINLVFKPFNRIIYYSYYDYESPSFPDKMKSMGRAKILEMVDYDKNNVHFEMEVSNVNRRAAGPSRYKTGGSMYPHSAYGIIGFWDYDFREQVPGIGIEILYRETMLLFPFFNERNEFKIGEEISLTIKTPFLFDMSGRESKYAKSVNVDDNWYVSPGNFTQRIISTEDFLGYHCARIEYSIDSKYTDHEGRNFFLNIEGTLHFAIEEGFVVSDISKGYQDFLRQSGEIHRHHYWKKLRVLGYEPYKGEPASEQ